MLKGKCLFCFSIIVLLISSFALTNRVIAQSGTKLYVDPSVAPGDPGEEFEIQIKVEDVEKPLWSWYFLLSWNASLLEVPDDPDTVGTVEGVTEGSFLKNVGATRVSSKFPSQMQNETTTTLLAMCSLTSATDPLDAPTGSGTLAIITFVVKAEGECPLDLYETELCYLKSRVEPTPILIDHTVEDGYYKYGLPILSLEPSIIMNKTFAPDSSFTINISVVDVGKAEPIQYLYNWSFSLYWDPTILTATNVTEGPFLNQSGPTSFPLPKINQTGGYLRANCTLLDPANAVIGNGTLASVTFLVVGRGETILNLDETQLIDSGGNSILHTYRDGYFNNAASDVAVTEVVASPTTVKAGGTVTINVTVRNVGLRNETSIDVSVVTPSPPSPSYKAIGTQPIVRLDPHEEASLTFTWDTKGAAKGNYTVRAQVNVLGDEFSGNDVKDTYVDVTSTQGLPTTLIIGAIIVVVVIAIAIFLYTRRKPTKT